MELSRLRYFLNVAREGNFARAARRLAVAPSTLYRRLKDLEYDLGVTLFDRSEGDVRLSAAGQLFAPHAQRIVEEATRIAEKMGSLAKGRAGVVRVGINGIAAELPEVSAALIRARTELPDLEILLVALHSEGQIARVQNGQLDLGLVYTRIDADAVAHAAVQHQRFVLAVANDHPLAQVESPRLADLAEENVIFQVRFARGVIHDRLIAACSAGGLQPRINHYIIDEDTQMAMVAAGMGVTLTLEGAAARRWRRQVAFRPLVDLDVAVNLDLIWNPNDLSEAARRVIDVIRR
jgi:DNA-binding transcriptional LysR family regulator